jgi:hypothetical protein
MLIANPNETARLRKYSGTLEKAISAEIRGMSGLTPIADVMVQRGDRRWGMAGTSIFA